MKSTFISVIFVGCMCAMLAYPAEQAPNPHSKPRYSSECSAEYPCPVGFECIITGDSIIYAGQGKCVPSATTSTPPEESPTDTGDVTDTTFILTSTSSTTVTSEPSEPTVTTTELGGEPTSSPGPSSSTSESTTTSRDPAVETTLSADPSLSNSETISEPAPAPCQVPSFDFTQCTDGGAFEIMRIGPNTASQKCFATNTICERQANELCGFSLGPNFISECVLNSASGF